MLQSWTKFLTKFNRNHSEPWPEVFGLLILSQVSLVGWQTRVPKVITSPASIRNNQINKTWHASNIREYAKKNIPPLFFSRSKIAGYCCYPSTGHTQVTESEEHLKLTVYLPFLCLFKTSHAINFWVTSWRTWFMNRRFRFRVADPAYVIQLAYSIFLTGAEREMVLTEVSITVTVTVLATQNVS